METVFAVYALDRYMYRAYTDFTDLFNLVVVNWRPLVCYGAMVLRALN